MDGEDNLPASAAAASAAIVEIENPSKQHGFHQFALSLGPAITTIMAIGFPAIAGLNFRRS